nr:hypothetical protein [Tanacetum cinerariifolium]
MSLFHQRQCHGCGQPCDGYYRESCTCPQCGMTLFNGICEDCIYGAGMPIICTTCGGIVRGGLCLPCDLREKNFYNSDPNAYSFNNSNYFPQPQDENYLCNLCGNNSHDDYDCQQQFPFVYEQEPSYNQNYDDNYYPHKSLSFPCCDYCGGSHETFQCQPDNQNADFSSSDQIQTLLYPDVNSPSPEISNEEIFQAKGDLMKSIQTFLEIFNCIPFEEKPQILFQTWETFFAIQCSQPEDSNKLFQKLLKDLKELAEYDQSTRTDRSIFLNDNEDHHVQNRESPENSSEENVVSKTNQEPPQDSDIHQLIEECSIEVPEEQKQNMEKTMLDLERLINLVENDIPNNSSNDPLLEEVNLFLSNNSIPPCIENVVDDPEGDIRFLEELLIDDSILSHELSDANFEDNLSISRPPPEPPDDNFDLEPEVISAVMEDIDEPDKHFNLGGEISVSTNNEDVDYFPFLFVIQIFLPYLILPEISLLFLSAESEDTILDPGLSPED